MNAHNEKNRFVAAGINIPLHCKESLWIQQNIVNNREYIYKNNIPDVLFNGDDDCGREDSYQNITAILFQTAMNYQHDFAGRLIVQLISIITSLR